MKKIFWIIGVLMMLVVVFLWLGNRKERQLKRRGNELVGKIESFRKKKGRLPDNLMDIKEEAETELFYSKFDSVHYVLWFGTSLGESMTYYSDSGKWEEVQRGF